jgi:hypothetical protein
VLPLLILGQICLCRSGTSQFFWVRFSVFCGRKFPNTSRGDQRISALLKGSS